MQRVLVAKFSVPEMADKLLDTGDLHLVESNYWHDQYWGDCYCEAHAETAGVNMLGELLMGIRTAVKGWRDAD